MDSYESNEMSTNETSHIIGDFMVNSTRKQLEVRARYEDMIPEDITDMMNTRSGIKALRSKLFGKQELFDNVAYFKIRSILYEGNIEKTVTVEDLYRVMNREHNYELLHELLGSNETEQLWLKTRALSKRNWLLKFFFRYKVCLAKNTILVCR